MKRVYVCSRLRETPERTMSDNLRRARQLCLAAVKQGVAPFAPHLFFTQFLDDWNQAEREAGIRCGAAFLSMCDEMWVDVKHGISTQMEAEVEEAGRLGLQVLVAPTCWDEVPL